MYWPIRILNHWSSVTYPLPGSFRLCRFMNKFLFTCVASWEMEGIFFRLECSYIVEHIAKIVTALNMLSKALHDTMKKIMAEVLNWGTSNLIWILLEMSGMFPWGFVVHGVDFAAIPLYQLPKYVIKKCFLIVLQFYNKILYACRISKNNVNVAIFKYFATCRFSEFCG